MAIPIEQFTAPGKYEVDLAMERITAELKNTNPMYNGLKSQQKYQAKSKYYSNSGRKK